MEAINVLSEDTEARPEHAYITTIECLNYYGCDPSNHIQRKISKEILEQQDLIICMGNNHREVIENMGFDCMLFNEIAFGPRNLQLPEDEIVARVDKVLKTTRLSKYRDAHPLSLSGGEKQRLALASVVVMEPEILVLDEPTTGLDLLSIQGILEIVKELHKRNVTVLLITHDMELVSELSERVVVMENGKVIGDGTPKEIFANDELLTRASLEPPQIMKFSKILGLNPEVKVDALYKRIIDTL